VAAPYVFWDFWDSWYPYPLYGGGLYGAYPEPNPYAGPGPLTAPQEGAPPPACDPGSPEYDPDFCEDAVLDEGADGLP
jgi:hypothetical protein